MDQFGKDYDTLIIGAGPSGLLFVAGDGAGKSRGIVGAAVNGAIEAAGILRRIGRCRG
jgi:hypothetical protein